MRMTLGDETPVHDTALRGEEEIPDETRRKLTSARCVEALVKPETPFTVHGIAQAARLPEVVVREVLESGDLQRDLDEALRFQCSGLMGRYLQRAEEILQNETCPKLLNETGRSIAQVQRTIARVAPVQDGGNALQRAGELLEQARLLGQLRKAKVTVHDDGGDQNGDAGDG